jgi:hypothetical protein
MERFYPLFDFSTQLLCELFADACKVGKLLVEFVEKYKLIPQPDDEISAAESLIMDFEFKLLREPSSLN